jgi:membrane protein
MDPADVRGGLARQIEALMGAGAATEVRSLLEQAERPGGGPLPTLLGILAVLFGATGAVIQLQATLDRVWGVQVERGGIRGFLLKRVFSLAMILALAFFLLVSLLVSAALSAFGSRLEQFGIPAALLLALNFVVSFAVITLIFAAMFKILPDARTAWRDVWIGAGFTAALFMAGKFLIGFYLGKSNPGEAYGAAGSLALLLVWIYYSSIIVLFGAEFTETWAERRGEGVEPEAGAVRVRRVVVTE